MARVNLQLIDQKLNDLIELVKTHAAEDREQFATFRAIIEGERDEPGLKGRLDRLEQNEDRRAGHIKALWAATFAGVIAWLVSFLQASAKP